MEDPLEALKRRDPDLFIKVVSGEMSLGRILERKFQKLRPGTAARIGISENELADCVSVQLSVSTEVNGRVATFEGHTLVVINIALMMFLHKMLKVFVGTLGIGNDAEHAIEMPIEPFSRIVSACKALLDAFWEDRMLAQAGFSLTDLGECQTNVHNRLLDLCESFAIAHELGHVIIMLSGQKLPEHTTAEEMVREFLQMCPDLPAEVSSTMMEPWSDELCADLIALDLMLSQVGSESYPREPLSYFYDGVEVFQILFGMVKEYRERRSYGSNLALVQSHPHSLLRMHAIRKARKLAGVSLGDRFQMGTTCYRFSRHVLDQIFGETPDQ